MPDDTPSASNDIIQNDAQSFVVGVPDANHTFANYLRLGAASTADEGALQQDPAATTTSKSQPPLISNAGTTSPFTAGTVGYSNGTMQLVAPYSYIRLGQTTPYETWLPPVTTSNLTSTGPQDTPFAPTAGGSFPAKGVVIYSNDTIQTSAPTISQTTNEFTSWSADSLSVVLNGDEVMSASRNYGSGGWSAQFTRADQMNTTLGTTTNAITGQSITQWLGNDASTGLGGLLWSNFGTTQNVFGGQVVNLFDWDIDVQGSFATKIQGQSTSVATQGFTFAVIPIAGAARYKSYATVGKINFVAGLIATAVEVAMDILSDVEVTKSSDDDSAMRDATKRAFEAVATASTAIVVLQAMTALMGLIAYAYGKTAWDACTAGIKISDGMVVIKAGASEFQLSTTGVRMFTNTVGENALVYDVNANRTGFSV